MLAALFDIDESAHWCIPFEVRESPRGVVFDKPLPHILAPQDTNAKHCQRALKHTLAHGDNVNYDIWRLDDISLLIR